MKKKQRNYYRINMVLYLLVHPTVLINLINNLNTILPFLRKLKVDIIMGGNSTGNVLSLIFILSRILQKKL